MTPSSPDINPNIEPTIEPTGTDAVSVDVSLVLPDEPAARKLSAPSVEAPAPVESLPHRKP